MIERTIYSVGLGGDLCILEGDSCDLNADFHATNCTCMCNIGFDGDGLYCISKYYLSSYGI